jgi:micrococcal nuclease
MQEHFLLVRLASWREPLASVLIATALAVMTPSVAAQSSAVPEFTDKPKAVRQAKPAPSAEPGSKGWLDLHGEPSQAQADPPGAGSNALAPTGKDRYVRGEFTGVVTHVTDGDTVWVALPAGSTPVKLRIEGIDAPEICQAGGAEAKAALAERALKRAVTVRVRAIDTYGRRVGKIFDDTEDIGARQVKNGHAWSLRYRRDKGPYIREERVARSLSRGLHQGGTAIEPRLFRQQHGSCKTESPAR